MGDTEEIEWGPANLRNNLDTYGLQLGTEVGGRSPGRETTNQSLHDHQGCNPTSRQVGRQGSQSEADLRMCKQRPYESTWSFPLC